MLPEVSLHLNVTYNPRSKGGSMLQPQQIGHVLGTVLVKRAFDSVNLVDSKLI